MKIDIPIRESSSWNQLFTRLQPMADEKWKGDVFERVVQLYLKTNPRYRTKLSNVWLHTKGEVPKEIRTKINLPGPDEGIDLIAETFDKKYWSIQAKFRGDPEERLTNTGLSTFTTLSFLTCKGIEYGLVCATTNLPIKKTHLYREKVGFVLLPEFVELDDHNFAGWNQLKSALRRAPKRPQKRERLSHQERAITNACEHYVLGRQPTEL